MMLQPALTARISIQRLSLLAFGVAIALPAMGIEASTILDTDGRLVQFQRDIAPILSQHCLECHGPEDAKNDFRVDEVESMMQYVEPEDVAASSLFVDYLTTDDEDMRMPPVANSSPLSPAELALIRTWISEGANWPEEASVVATSAADTVVVPVTAIAAPKTFASRIWAFQGYLHPATIHFPIALLSVGALFVLLGIKWPQVGTQIPLACLVLGGISAVVATAMGWSFAAEQGYANWAQIDFESQVFWHRWSGTLVAFGSVVLILIAVLGYWRDSDFLGVTWKIGLLALAAIVGAAGHQGGELTYGKDFYPKAFAILRGTEGEKPAPVAVNVEPVNNPDPENQH